MEARDEALSDPMDVTVSADARVGRRRPVVLVLAGIAAVGVVAAIVLAVPAVPDVPGA